MDAVLAWGAMGGALLLTLWLSFRFGRPAHEETKLPKVERIEVERARTHTPQ